MTKDRAMRVKIGDKAWSPVTGLGELYPITEVIHAGPRRPYFRIRGQVITYRNVVLGDRTKTLKTPAEMLKQRRDIDRATEFRRRARDRK